MADNGLMEEPESHYRDLLAKQVAGETEVRLPFGRCDVLTGTTVYEVEPIARWRVGAAQALQYGGQVEQRAALALYGRAEALPDVWLELSRLPAPGLELWWFADCKFVVVSSYEEACSCIPPEPALESAPKCTPWKPQVPESPPVAVANEVPNEPLPTHNSMGYEVWDYTHLPNGEVRPELQGLSMPERAKTIAAHAPDFSEEQKRQIRLILWGAE
jgi:hypothetical protein